ncbi:MAG: hypothetical protein HY842_10990 [Bacteroidetes bacterium]|nr:hypothetical protein [Bacteroidota bacterium]
MQKSFFLLLLSAFAFAMPGTTSAQTLNGDWEGVQVVQKKPFPKDMTFDWNTRSYNYNLPQGFFTYVTELYLDGTDDQIAGTWRTAEKYGKATPGHYEIGGSFNPATGLFVWQPTKRITGPNFANTINRTMTLLEDGTYEYLEGRWTSQDGDNGIMFYRRLIKVGGAAAPAIGAIPANVYVGTHQDGGGVALTLELGAAPKASYEYVAKDGTKSTKDFRYDSQDNDIYTFKADGLFDEETWTVTVKNADEIVLEFQSPNSAGPLTLTRF